MFNESGKNLCRREVSSQEHHHSDVAEHDIGVAFYTCLRVHTWLRVDIPVSRFSY